MDQREITKLPCSAADVTHGARIETLASHRWNAWFKVPSYPDVDAVRLGACKSVEVG